MQPNTESIKVAMGRIVSNACLEVEGRVAIGVAAATGGAVLDDACADGGAAGLAAARAATSSLCVCATARCADLGSRFQALAGMLGGFSEPRSGVA